MTFSRAASRSEELMQASFFSRSIGALTLFVMLLTTMTAWAETVNNVSYREYDTSTKVFEDKTCPSATVVEQLHDAWCRQQRNVVRGRQLRHL